MMDSSQSDLQLQGKTTKINPIILPPQASKTNPTVIQNILFIESDDPYEAQTTMDLIVIFNFFSCLISIFICFL